MGDRSGIEWTDATWNPVTGCEKVSAGCANCYAERVFPRAYGKVDWDLRRKRRFTDVEIHRDRFDQPLRWRKPRRIFVNSMSDLFHEDVPFEVIDKLIRNMAQAQQHTFQILTKRPMRMLEWVKSHQPIGGQLMPNIWWGVSCEDQATADERIPLLLQMPAAVRFVSLEPLLGSVDLWSAKHKTIGLFGKTGAVTSWDGHGLDWVIVGGESGPNARPMHPDWVRSIRGQCVEAGVPFHFKQWGEWAPDCIHDGPTFRACRSKARPEPGRMGVMFRCGKKRAGREIDGRTWDQFPAEVLDG